MGALLQRDGTLTAAVVRLLAPLACLPSPRLLSREGDCVQRAVQPIPFQQGGGHCLLSEHGVILPPPLSSTLAGFLDDEGLILPEFVHDVRGTSPLVHMHMCRNRHNYVSII